MQITAAGKGHGREPRGTRKQKAGTGAEVRRPEPADERKGHGTVTAPAVATTRGSGPRPTARIDQLGVAASRTRTDDKLHNRTSTAAAGPMEGLRGDAVGCLRSVCGTA